MWNPVSLLRSILQLIYRSVKIRGNIYIEGNRKKPCNFETPRLHVASRRNRNLRKSFNAALLTEYKFNRSLCVSRGKLLPLRRTGYSFVISQRFKFQARSNIYRTLPPTKISSSSDYAIQARRSLHGACQVLRSHAFPIFFPSYKSCASNLAAVRALSSIKWIQRHDIIEKYEGVSTCVSRARTHKVYKE